MQPYHARNLKDAAGDDRRDPRILALAAGSAAASALNELLRFAREGDGIESRFDEDVLEQLLDAAKLVAEIEGDFSDLRGQVYGAICNYLDGWVG